MSRKNGNQAPTQPSPILGEHQNRGGGKEITVWLTEDEVKLLIQMVRITPVQGTLQSLAQMLEKLVSLQEKLEGSLQK